MCLLPSCFRGAPEFVLYFPTTAGCSPFLGVCLTGVWATCISQLASTSSVGLALGFPLFWCSAAQILGALFTWALLGPGFPPCLCFPMPPRFVLKGPFPVSPPNVCRANVLSPNPCVKGVYPGPVCPKPSLGDSRVTPRGPEGPAQGRHPLFAGVSFQTFPRGRPILSHRCVTPAHARVRGVSPAHLPP